MENKNIIAIGSDHAGFLLKDILKKFLVEKLNFEVLDQGPFDASSVDYPDYSYKVAQQVNEKQIFGLLICGSGMGISVTANKIKGIRAALCHDSYTAQKAREDLDCNVIAFGERVTGNEVAQQALKVFLETKFLEKNRKNVEKLQKIEEQNLQINSDYDKLCEWCYFDNFDAKYQVEGFKYVKSCKRCFLALTFAITHFKYDSDEFKIQKGIFKAHLDCIIENKLFLGNRNASRSKEMLKERGVTDILVAGNNLEEHFPGEFNYKTLKIDDNLSEDVTPILKEAVEFIEQGKVVFVHCFAGVSRSTSMVLAYLLTKQKKVSLEDQITFVRSRRPIIRPNDSFVEQLKIYQKSLQN